MSGRKSISKKTRFEVFKRDLFTCQYCGKTPPSVILEIDHIVPVSGGGDNSIENLISSCFDCNRGKGATSLSVIPESIGEKAKKAQELEDQLALYKLTMEKKKERIIQEGWDVAEILDPGCSDRGFRVVWMASIKRFLELLPLWEVEQAAQIAKARKPNSDYQAFKYFCGVCWNKVRSEDA